MKKVIIYIVMVLLLLLYSSNIAWANNEWPHNGYSNVNNNCANCHTTNTPGTNDLVNTDITKLCYVCHNGTESKYNEETGFINGTFPTMGGGFQVLTTTKNVTSFHKIGTTVWGVPGSNTLKTSYKLTCDSCHNPHGSNNYRNLRTTVNNKNIAVTANVITSTDGSEIVYYLNGMDNFCSSCHEDFLNNTNSNFYNGKYRHKVSFDPTKSPVEYGYNPNNGLPMELNESTYTGNSSADTLSCITCHFAHSTKAKKVSNPLSKFKGSNLLRTDGYSVCQKCHIIN